MTDKLDDAALAAIKARASHGMQRGGITASDYTGPIVLVQEPDWSALLAEVERLRAELDAQVRETFLAGQVAYEQSQRAEKAETDAAALREALEPFANYARQRARAPFRGLDDVIHGIHIGTEYEAEIRLSHCEAARAALARAGGGS